MAVALRDIDHGFEAMRKRYASLRHAQIAVGILDRGAEQHRGGLGRTVLDVAIWQEFGTRSADGKVHVPARSFIRAWYDENQAVLKTWVRAMTRNVLAGRWTPEQGLTLLAQRCVASIQARMAAGIGPPLARSTIRRKGSSKPLIDTGQLRSSNTYQIRKKG